MKYNGFWSNGKKRLVVIRTSKDGMIHYREVDEKGKTSSKLQKDWAEEVLPSFLKEGSNEPFKSMY
ncbi:hypothetical protein [Bacillus phage vB_BceM_Bc431v3]|uniref:Uncharacterized protein n=3 Tax=Caeruleovirus TaxID=1911929 RepID=A0A0S2MUB8_9CAUD|nr:hypothetical protein K201_gp031 [Bacillus phage vB_BceM_Bc431v3]YP_009626598.1 hypothetical protein FD732_gp032 [Bacillus phage BM15]AFQ96339.1 hypothetical protein [Bacillus phage vB_BceM_Bc431v3]ALO79453.1 hypothetical protein BM10_32 [Bacillus phage BM15]AXQ66813.1 hypothetical protein HOBO_32 [Bacillus phage Hobo]